MSPDHMQDELALRELYQQYVNLYNEDPQDMLTEDDWMDGFNKL